MWWNNLRARWLIPLGLVSVGAAAAACLHFAAADPVSACFSDNHDDVARVNCWSEVIRQTFDTDGTAAAFDVFDRIYREYDTFSNTGCHRHAHRVGDMAYYFGYLATQDLDAVEFPPGATACGYGFYHGFFEHLIQDHPDPAFVTKVCDYMDRRLDATAPAIRQTCYHGSGHGFILAGADTLTASSSWTPAAFTAGPLLKCETLPKATDREISECRQGVYNVLVDWMSDGEYGLSYDSADPFAFCDRERYQRQSDCYYEMAQKVDSASGQDPIRAVAIANAADRADLRDMVLSAAVAGMVQHDPKGDQSRLLTACRTLTGDLFSTCVSGITGGLVAHDTAGDNYAVAFAFCSRPDLRDDERDTCYATLRVNLGRFMTPAAVAEICGRGAVPEIFCSTPVSEP